MANREVTLCTYCGGEILPGLVHLHKIPGAQAPQAQPPPVVSWSAWLDEVVEIAAADYFAKWPAKEHGQELAFQDAIHEAFEKIGNQIGGIDATPTPVGRAGSLPGKAQAGSPTSSNDQDQRQKP